MKKYFLVLIATTLVVSSAQAFQMQIVEDFEQATLVMGTNADNIGVGYIPFFDNNFSSPIGISLSDSPPALVPGSTTGNQVMVNSLTSTGSSFAGYVNLFTNASANEWLNQDWSAYEGIRFWVYGNSSGLQLFIDILDNRNPGSSTDDAERFTYVFTDNFTGWELITVPFVDFTRKSLSNGAPNDGLGLTEMHGYAFGYVGTLSGTFYFDDLELYGTAPLSPSEIQFSASQYEVNEGESIEIEVVLDKVSMQPVTFTYATAQSLAVPGRDFDPVQGSLTIPAGELSATFNISTIGNDKSDGDRRLILVLSSVDGAEFGLNRTALLTILDDDPTDPDLLDDFERCHLFEVSGGVELTLTELELRDDTALPCQGDFEFVLEANGAGTLSRRFTEPQDWRNEDGLSFWFYGNGTGASIPVTLRDNQFTTTATTMPNNWTLAWSDEFNESSGTPPNPNIWVREIGNGSLYGTPGWSNSELQYFTDDPENAFIDGNGNLVISVNEVNQQTTDLTCFYGPCQYTSARLTTKDKLAFKYGGIEARILMPGGGDGLWASLVAQGTKIDEVGFPQAGEISVGEYVSRVPNEIFGQIQGPGYSGGNAFGGLYDFGVNVAVADDYRIFRVDWTPDRVRWYIDGTLFHEADPSSIAPNEWVFNDAFFLLLDLSLGGNFGGGVDANLTFPQQMLIDYVRVYQAEDTAERFETSFVDTQEGWQLINLPFSEFARSNNQPANAPDDGLNLDEVLGFDIDLPSELTMANSVFFDQIRIGTRSEESLCRTAPLPLMTNNARILLMGLLLMLGVLILFRNRFLI